MKNRLENLLKYIDKLKTEVDSLRPLSQEQLNQIKDYYKIGLTYSSNALEGNTLTESETKVVIEDGLTVGGKPLKDIFEAVGHAESLDFLYKIVKNQNITEHDIKKLHYIFYRYIDENQAGKYRDKQVFISGSKYPLPKPADLNNLMKNFVDKLNSLDINPVLAATWAHKEFVFIHPFIDGNGRIARLLLNLILLKHGFPVTIIPPILRAQYISSLEKAHTDDTEYNIFIAECVKESLQDFLRLFQF